MALTSGVPHDVASLRSRFSGMGGVGPPKIWWTCDRRVDKVGLRGSGSYFEYPALSISHGISLAVGGTLSGPPVNVRG